MVAALIGRVDRLGLAAHEPQHRHGGVRVDDWAQAGGLGEIERLSGHREPAFEDIGIRVANVLGEPRPDVVPVTDRIGGLLLDGYAISARIHDGEPIVEWRCGRETGQHDVIDVCRHRGEVHLICLGQGWIAEVVGGRHVDDDSRDRAAESRAREQKRNVRRYMVRIDECGKYGVRINGRKRGNFRINGRIEIVREISPGIVGGFKGKMIECSRDCLPHRRHVELPRSNKRGKDFVRCQLDRSGSARRTVAESQYRNGKRDVGVSGCRANA